jgi:polar amino acid transport system substrate-binding protein
MPNVKGGSMRIFVVFALILTGGFAQSLSVTPNEKQQLASYRFLCTSTTAWAPFNTEKDGELAGIGIDYWRLIARRLGIPFRCEKAASWQEVLDRLQTGRADLTVATEKTDERSRYAVFSKPYVSYPYVVVTRKDVGFIYDMHLLQGKKLVAGRRYTVVDVLKKHYPELTVVEVDSVEDALEKVASGRAYAVIDVLPVLAYKLNDSAYKDLKISGMLPERFSARIMLRKTYAPLVPLIDRVIETISVAERREINRKWTRVYRANAVPTWYLYIVGSVALAFALIFWLHTRRLKETVEQQKMDIRQLEEMARIDGLTGIYNRRMMDTMLAQQVAISKRYRQMLSVIFFDIDYFKTINDRYGHVYGDDVLKIVTMTIGKEIRTSDIFGRWGGDEFLIILPETSRKQATRLAEHLYRSIAQRVFPNGIRVTCSFGVVSYRYGDTIQSLLERADEELYRAKKHKASLVSDET